MDDFTDTAFDAFIQDLPRPIDQHMSRHPHDRLVDITTLKDTYRTYFNVETGKVVQDTTALAFAPSELWP